MMRVDSIGLLRPLTWAMLVVGVVWLSAVAPFRRTTGLGYVARCVSIPMLFRVPSLSQNVVIQYTLFSVNVITRCPVLRASLSAVSHRGTARSFTAEKHRAVRFTICTL